MNNGDANERRTVCPERRTGGADPSRAFPVCLFDQVIDPVESNETNRDQVRANNKAKDARYEQDGHPCDQGRNRHKMSGGDVHQHSYCDSRLAAIARILGPQ
jgi:hypothetical protein